MTNLVTNVATTAQEHPEETAVYYDGTTISYREFWARTGQFAAALEEAGFGTDDRVAIYLPNLPQFLVSFHGTLRAGGAVVPMNPQYKAREIEHLLTDSGARVVIALDDLVPFVEEVQAETDVEEIVSVGGDSATPFRDFLVDGQPDPVERDDDDVAVQPYTSGTTGQPKGVLLTHRNLTSNAETAADLVPGGIRTEDRLLGVLPLFHIYGMTVVMNSGLFNGGTFYAMASWEPEAAVELTEREELTILHGVPAMYNDVINLPDAESHDLSSVRLAGVGGSGIPAEVLHTFEEYYDAKIYEGYGLTETSPVTHFNTPERGRRVGSIGKPLPAVESRVVDEDFESAPPVEAGPIDEEEADLETVTGEIVVNGPNVMRGYNGLPEANEAAFTEADGKRWFHTGDIGYRDEDGYFYVIDREKHVIVSGGYNVYPREVEELLYEHEAVAEAAVVGVPDDRRGEIPKAYVVLRPGAEVTEDEIIEYCLSNLAEYKHPREVAFVDELPRTTTGKVQKFELRERETRTAD